MRRRLLRILDRWIGHVVAWKLAVCDRTLGRVFRRSADTAGRGAAPRNILAIKIVGVGDTVLMLSPLKRLRERFPDARICVLVTPLSAGIVAGQPVIDSIIEYDVLGKHKGLLSFLRLISLLRSQRFDCVIDFEQYFRLTAILSYLSGAPRRIGLYYGSNPRRLLLTDPVVADPGLHMVDSYMSLLTPLGIEAEPIRVLEDIHIASEDEEVVDTWLRARGISRNGPIVGIHSGSGPRGPFKRWDPDRFAEIIQRLRGELGAQVVLTGSEPEKESVAEILRLVGDDGVYDAAGQFSIVQIAALAKRCSLFISNDTGPMHIAAAVGTPTIGLFGPELPRRYAPIGNRNTTIHKTLECTPCVHIYAGRADGCGDPRCMRAITVDDVWEAIERYDLTGHP